MLTARTLSIVGFMAIAAPAIGAGVEADARTEAGSIPIKIKLDRPGLATVVIDDDKGDRVRNLIGETPLPAGESTVWWDGYDEGSRNESGDWIRGRVAAGTYRVRGIVHDRIMMRYEFSINSPGSPPWKTRDGKGAWLADHSPPADVLFLPGDARTPYRSNQDHILVCSTSGESGEEFVWMTPEGKREFGINTGFWGGFNLCREAGDRPSPKYYAYVLMSGERDHDNDDFEIRGFKPDGSIESVLKVKIPHPVKQFKTLAQAYGSNGLASFDGLVVASWTQENKLLLIDADAKSKIGEYAIEAPTGISFDNSGNLYVITGKKIVRLILSKDRKRFVAARTIVQEGLEDPRRVLVDVDGTLFAADWGRSHQIKVFSNEGKLIRTIGRAGGPQIGVYDDQRMSNPCGMTIDRNRTLWVAEAENHPKRLSLWKTDGTFLRGIYGPPKYGGGGAIDPFDRTRFYYAEYEKGGGTEFSIDWKTGRSTVKAIDWRPESFAETIPGPAPERSIRLGKHQYLFNCFNGQLRFNQDRGAGIWRIDADHIARPVAVIGNGADLVNGIWGWRFKNQDEIVALWKDKDPARIFFIWSDRNGDHEAQANEFRFVETTRVDDRGEPLREIGLAPLIHDDLSITTSYGTRIAPPRIDERGTPIYDPRDQTIVGDAKMQRSPLIAGDRAITSQDGIAAIFGVDLNGRRRWRYNATEEGRTPLGSLVEPTRILGPPVEPPKGGCGNLFAISGEKGTIYLLTLDGLFIQTLGGDSRIAPLWRMNEARRGMIVDGVSFEDEHFHPTITQTRDDGSIYLVVGKEHSSVVKLEGLESVKRYDWGSVAIDTSHAAARRGTLIAEKSRKTDRNVLRIVMTDAAPTIDGDLSDWPKKGESWARIDDRASASIAIGGGNLSLAFHTDDPDLLSNSANDDRLLFKTGGALDLQIATGSKRSGGQERLRLLVARAHGEIKAIVYRDGFTGAAENDRVRFDSPIGTVFFDRVENVTKSLTFAQSKGDYELSIPLSVLRFDPRHGVETSGDLGVLRGDGAQTTSRVYWNNLDTGLVSDIPSEARLRPDHWGVFVIE